MRLTGSANSEETNFALQLKGWRENMENFCGSKPPEGGCGSRQAQGFYPLWQPTASVFHGNRRFADCDPIAQFDRFDPRTTIGLPLEVRAVSRALDFLIPVSEALPQRGTRDSNPQPRVPTRSQNRKRPNAQSHRANGGVSAAAALGWLSLHLLVARPRAPTHVLLLQLCAAALAGTVLSGFPFTATSAVTGHWLYGAKGCIAQAFIQHVGVVVQLWTLSALALERWRCSRPALPLPPPSPPPPARWYARALALPWLLAVAVAAPPLAGWGSFGCDVSGVWCSVNWSGGGSGSAIAYAVFALLAGRLVPATVTVWCLCGTRVALPAPPSSSSSCAQQPAPRPRTPHSCSAARRAHGALNAVARLTGAGVLLLRAPRVILDLHLAAVGLSWDHAPRVLAYMAPVTDEALPLNVSRLLLRYGA
ncbi:Rhodopsin [Frankliniella fusca]|uniref:Rhodopsin n=1 Tax=Frankliniella fusca TaxID=407009 RepID=A0AAE1H4H9_9NEOP|nr:Rhodopsin [Frankliniella fusca]